MILRMDIIKVCIKCGIEKPNSDFPEYQKGKTKNICKRCSTAAHQKRAGATYHGYLTALCTKARSARKKSDIPFEIDHDYLIELWEQQNGRCAISNVHMTHHSDGKGRKDFNASIDRIIPELGYIHGNVQLVCDRVNTMRHTLTMDMFYWWVKAIHEHSCD